MAKRTKPTPPPMQLLAKGAGGLIIGEQDWVSFRKGDAILLRQETIDVLVRRALPECIAFNLNSHFVIISLHDVLSHVRNSWRQLQQG